MVDKEQDIQRLRIIGSKGERIPAASAWVSEPLGRIIIENITIIAAEQKSYDCVKGMDGGKPHASA